MYDLELLSPLPTQKVPDPWKSSLQHLTTTTQFIPISSALQKHIDYSDQDWWIALWWVIKKKWDKKLKFPGKPKKYRNYLEARGELFLQTLELCQACHSKLPQLHEQYSHPSDWYFVLMKEAKQQDVKAIIDNEPSGKTAFIEDRSNLIRDLKTEAYNSLDPEKSPHLYHLIEAALSLGRDKDFVKDHWKPYIKAIRQWTGRLKQLDCQEAFVEDGYLLHRTGIGQGKITYQ